MFCINVSAVISSEGSGHISALHVQVEALDGNKTSVISSIFYFSFFFWTEVMQLSNHFR